MTARRRAAEAEPGPLRAYSVWCTAFPEFPPEVVNATSAGQAKTERWRSIEDAYPDLPYTTMRATVIGPPQTPESFLGVAQKRGLPEARCGDRIGWGRGQEGAIIGSDASCNWEVRVEAGPGIGNVVHVHPHDCEYLTGAYAGRKSA